MVQGGVQAFAAGVGVGEEGELAAIRAAKPGGGEAEEPQRGRALRLPPLEEAARFLPQYLRGVRGGRERPCAGESGEIAFAQFQGEGTGVQIMAAQAVMHTGSLGHLLGDVPALFAVAGVLWWLTPRAAN